MIIISSYQFDGAYRRLMVLWKPFFNPQVDGQGKTDSLEPGDW